MVLWKESSWTSLDSQNLEWSRFGVFYVFVLGNVSISVMHVLVLTWVMVICLLYIVYFYYTCFGEFKEWKNILQCVVLEEQTLQPIDGALASCHNHVCTKTLHIDIISIQGSYIRLESLQAKAGYICIECLIYIELYIYCKVQNKNNLPKLYNCFCLYLSWLNERLQCMPF